MRILPNGVRENLLYAFEGGKDGAYPAAALIAAPDGNLYGTTKLGGGSALCVGGCGTVYRLTPHGTGYIETVLYRFKGSGDGANPEGSLLLDKNYDLFGTASAGGSKKCTNGCGTVFELVREAGTYSEKTLHTFSNSPDGANPQAALLQLKSGILLGTTTGGGSSGYGCYGINSTCGTVFALKPSGDKYSESVVYSFLTPPDASAPQSDLLEVNGSIFGVGSNGGTGGCTAPNYTCGTVFALTSIGAGYSETVLSLSGWNGDYGPNPVGGLAANAAGDLFGAASGAFSANGGIFELEPTKTGTYLQRYVRKFIGAPHDGSVPKSAPIVGPTGIVYGTTVAGGSASCNCGTIYSLKPDGTRYVESIVFSFERGIGGTNPIGSLLENKRGALFGTASQGGLTANCNTGCGTVFEVVP